MFDIPIDLKYLEQSIIAYEQEPIETGKILFYGHSLFTRWGGGKWAEKIRPMSQDIRMKDGSLAVVNHGFGTSTTEDRVHPNRAGYDLLGPIFREALDDIL